MIPKKLDSHMITEIAKANPTGEWLIAEKVNEIIDHLEEVNKYLQLKESSEAINNSTIGTNLEASKPKYHKKDCRYMASAGYDACDCEEARKGECICPCPNEFWLKRCPAHKITKIPPEHEEESIHEMTIRDIQGQDWEERVQSTMSYIKANFVSKEKIKSLTAEADYDDIFNGFCNKCGGEIAYIRGKIPHSDKRRICTTCLVEQLEDLSQNNQPKKVGLGD